MPATYCILVSYNPDLSNFSKVIDSVLANTSCVIVVDNGSSNQSSLLRLLEGRVQVLALDENVGIAAAQNRALQTLQKVDYDFVWFSDQDTFYPDTYLAQAVSEFDRAQQKFPNLGALGPKIDDLNKGESLPFVVSYLPKKYQFAHANDLVQVKHLISSGMLVSRACLEATGGLDEKLFIDWVDLEWSWRANRLGWLTVGSGNLAISHQLGDDYKRFLGKKISTRAAIREYYQNRNAIYLALRSPYISVSERFFFVFKALLFSFIYTVISDKKIATFLLNVKALAHGVIGRMGKL